MHKSFNLNFLTNSLIKKHFNTRDKTQNPLFLIVITLDNEQESTIDDFRWLG